MTIVVAKREEGKIILASDNQTSWGGCKTDTKTSNSERGKIKQIDDQFAIACCGSVEEITIFQRYCESHKPKAVTENAVYDFMIDFKDYCKKGNDKFEFHSAYILVYHGMIFQVMYGYDVQLKNFYSALWSGMFEALVALEMWGDAKKAVEMAKKFDRGCGGETKTLEMDGSEFLKYTHPSQVVPLDNWPDRIPPSGKR